jgi:hypothetical protein
MQRQTFPSPPEVVCETLAEARRQGLPFDAAWSLAWKAMMRRISTLRSDARQEWKAATEGTREEWRAAYEREPTPYSIALDSRESVADAIADFICGPEPESEPVLVAAGRTS